MQFPSHLFLLPVLLLQSCITLTGEMTLPGGDKPGSVGGKIGFSGTWPGLKAKEPEPTLPEDPGKAPIPYLQ